LSQLDLYKVECTEEPTYLESQVLYMTVLFKVLHKSSGLDLKDLEYIRNRCMTVRLTQTFHIVKVTVIGKVCSPRVPVVTWAERI
jgi:hypothetical protein